MREKERQRDAVIKVGLEKKQGPEEGAEHGNPVERPWP